MQIDSVESNVGMPISFAPLTMASVSESPSRAMTLDVLDHNGGVIDQDSHRQRESAKRHGVQASAP